MPSLPLPIFTALFLCFLLLRLLIGYGRKTPKLLSAAIFLYALQSVQIGIRWGVGSYPTLLVAGVAFLLPPVTWLAFLQLTGNLTRKAVGWICGSTLLLFAAMGAAGLGGYGLAVDALGAGLYLTYGALCLHRAWRDHWTWTYKLPLNQVLPVRRSLLMAGAVLMASAGIDAIVAADLMLNQGRLAPSVVGAASLALLVALILSVAFSKQDGASPKTLASQKAKPILSTEPSHVELIKQLDRLMVTDKVYRDEALSLDKLASALKVQPRQLSTAVNSATQMSLPQYTNSFRIKEACELLMTTDQSVTAIFYDVGFTSKSNFHREFQRVTGMSPSAYRKQYAGEEVPR